MNQSEKYITPDIMARRLDISLPTVYRIIKRGDIKTRRFGKCYKIPETEFLAYTSQYYQPEN